MGDGSRRSTTRAHFGSLRVTYSYVESWIRTINNGMDSTFTILVSSTYNSSLTVPISRIVEFSKMGLRNCGVNGIASGELRVRVSGSLFGTYDAVHSNLERSNIFQSV